MGRGSTQEPPRCPFEISIHCAVDAIWNQFCHLRLFKLHQNLPQFFRRNLVADSISGFLDYFAETMSPMYLDYFIKITSPIHF